MSLVLDASLTLSRYFGRERTSAVDAIPDRVAANGAWAPSPWRLKVANGLRAAFRRNRVDAAFRDSALIELSRMPIAIDTGTGPHAWSATPRLAERLQLTLYDEAYLELAQRRHLPFAILDRPWRAAARTLSGGALGMDEYGGALLVASPPRPPDGDQAR